MTKVFLETLEAHDQVTCLDHGTQTLESKHKQKHIMAAKAG